MSLTAIDPFVAHIRAQGLIEPVPQDVIAAWRRHGRDPDVRRLQVSMVLAPIASDLRCCHCGIPVEPGQHPAVHAVAGFEHTDLRVNVLHCDGCYRTGACDPETTTPGSRLPDGCPGGYCVFPRGQEIVLGAEIVPGIRLATKLIARALAAGGFLYYMSTWATLIHSQGQQHSNAEGGNGAVAIQDSTAGHGFNGGAVRVFSGSAPADGNAAETGTLGVNVTLPNPLFGSGSGFPVTWTAGAISSATIAATITAAYFRMVTNADTGASSTSERRIQGDVATSGASMNVNTTAFVSGGSFNVTSLVYQGPP